jgi:serine/threonine protein kinase
MEGKYNFLVDWWAYGILLYELLSGQVVRNMRVVFKIEFDSHLS